MAKSNVDLNKLNGEIENRKKSRGIVSESGNNRSSGMPPRDEFLNGLLTSLNTGMGTNASNRLKVIENKVAIKNGETRAPINEIAPAPRQQQQSRHQAQYIEHLEDVDMSPERDEQLFRDMEKRRKSTLSESMLDYVNPAQANSSQMRYDPMTGKPLYPQNYGQPMQINEGNLLENVKKIVDEYLINNFSVVIEEAIKSTVIEMYATERIKDVLYENTEIIKGVIKEYVRENKEKKIAQQRV